MNKFTFSVLGAFLALILLVDNSYAQSPSGAARRYEKRQEVKEKFVENRTDKINKFTTRLIQRFEAMIVRLEKLIAKIESRVAKIKAENPDQDLGNIESQIQEAKNKISDSKSDLADIKTSLESILESSDPRSAFKQVSTNLRQVKRQLVESHTILVKTIGKIKGLKSE